MIYQLSQFKRSFQQLQCDCSNLEAVAREQNLEPRLLKAMKALSHTTPAAVKLKAAVLWQEFEDSVEVDGCFFLVGGMGEIFL